MKACPNLSDLTIYDGQFGDRGVNAVLACGKVNNFDGNTTFELSEEVIEQFPEEWDLYWVGQEL